MDFLISILQFIVASVNWGFDSIYIKSNQVKILSSVQAHVILGAYTVVRKTS